MKRQSFLILGLIKVLSNLMLSNLSTHFSCNLHSIQSTSLRKEKLLSSEKQAPKTLLKIFQLKSSKSFHVHCLTCIFQFILPTAPILCTNIKTLENISHIPEPLPSCPSWWFPGISLTVTLLFIPSLLHSLSPWSPFLVGFEELFPWYQNKNLFYT